MSLYNQLMARGTAKDELMKTASVKSPADIRAELESANIQGNTMEIIAGQLLGMFEKKAAEVEDAPVVEEVAEAPAAEAAAVEDPAVAAAAVAGDEQIQADAQDAAIASAKASINDAASAIDTLEAVTGNAPAAEEAVVADVPASAAGTETADASADDTEVVASEVETEAEKVAEEEEKKDEDSEKKEYESEDEEEDEEKEVEAAMAEFDRIMKEGSEEEKAEIMKLAYDQAIVKMANAGITLRQYIYSRVGDEYLAETIADNAEKLAALSSQNYLKVADDIIYQMEKTASEL